MRSFQTVNNESGDIVLQETPESKEKRGFSSIVLTKEERLEQKAHALKTWAEWGIMTDA